VTAIPYAWLLLFFLVPFLIVLRISLAEARLGMPPYTPLLEWSEGRLTAVRIQLQSYGFMLSDGIYLSAFLYSLRVAFVSTLLCLLIGYPMAYAIARAPSGRRGVLLMLVILPFWTSFLLRVYAWSGLLRNTGLINTTLLALGVIDQPIVMMQTDFAVYTGIVYSYLPFMILPLYANLEKHDPALLESAEDLGARPWKSFLRVTLPLSLPGIIAGSALVFIPAVGEFVIPSLLGGPDQLMIGRLLWDEFFSNRDGPRACAVAVVMLLLLVPPLVMAQRSRARHSESLP
jgi:putrescine transport system permease protein